ncbi:uncharacterized protein LOC126901049 [Daktulosphaira vitifoliae]|uniref:uncharacterized protein LOC126901049 n=1 Tax=Daktulosphaira vitifoliae TaxID=58002 RepID=UPI0021AA5F7C|nr:uncharacterized protein LOC126901049 [Daktulosphaira vitifoliae]
MKVLLTKIMVFKILILLDIVLSLKRTPLMPNLSVGKYKLKFKAVSICNETYDYPLKFKYYLSKVSTSKVLLMGNITLKIPFDDNLIIGMNLAVWSKIGGWKDNAYIYQNKEACSSLKFLMGKVWNEYIEKHHFTDCPIQSGFYKSSGFDLSFLDQANIPKEFFYGIYKYKIYFSNEKNDQVGCFYIIFDLLRLWELLLTKIMVYKILILLDIVLSLERTPLMPNLPAGKYKLKYKAISICNETIDYPLKFKYYLSKASTSKVVLMGNVTLKIPFDDNLNIGMNLAVWSKIGGWKDNSCIYQNKGACSSLKFLMGKVWNEYIEKHNFTNCPIQPGFYKSSGFDLSLLDHANIPKEFFYGTYKQKIFFLNEKNDQVGCFYIAFDLLRPWE